MLKKIKILEDIRSNTYIKRRKKNRQIFKMSSSKVKRFVSIKGVLDNLRQSVNSPTPPGANQGHGTGNIQFHVKNIIFGIL